MYQENILTLYRYRYLKWSIALVLVCIFSYVVYTPRQPQGGGTILGYALGSIGALLILWLMFLGVRKRAYQSTVGNVRGWLSAHIYLGLSLLVVITLHSAFNFGWNIHTLVYFLTIIVVSSGVWGVALYLTKPTLINNALNGKTLDQCAQVLEELDHQSEKVACQLEIAIQEMIRTSAKSKVFSRGWERYFGNYKNCTTNQSVKVLTELYSSHKTKSQTEQALLEQLFTLQLKKQLQLQQVRNYLRHKGWSEIWLVFHVPLSFALLGTLIAHIVSVFVYW